MTKRYDIYKMPVDKFKKRLWFLYAPYLIQYTIALIPIFFNLDGYKPIIISYVAFILLLCVFMLRVCYKRARKKVSRISIVGDSFEVEIIELNTVMNYRIPMQNLKVITKRFWGRPRFSKLTLFNSDKKLVDIYSATIKESSDLHYIKYTLDLQTA